LALALVVLVTAPARAEDQILFAGDKEFRNLEPGLHLAGEARAEVKEEGKEAETKAKPTLKLRGLTAGADLRMAYNTPGGLDSGVDTSRVLLKLGFVDFQRKETRVRYSSIASMTLGRGLLINNYASNERRAYYAGVQGKQGACHVLTTDTHLTAARVNLKLKGGIQMGGTYVEDTERPAGTPASAYSVDLQVPLRLPLLPLTAYGEFAKLKGAGQGFSLGALYSAGGGKLQWRHEISHYGARFVPGFYDAYYEVQPANLDTTAGLERTGFLSEVTIRPHKNVVALGYLRKNAGERPSLHSEVAAKILPNLRGALSLDAKNYGGKVQRTDDTLYQAKLIYGINPNMDLILEYSRTYPDENALDLNPIEYTLLKSRFKI